MGEGGQNAPSVSDVAKQLAKQDCRAVPPRPCLGPIAVHDIVTVHNRYAVHQGLLD
jgi:hypothetical protein